MDRIDSGGMEVPDHHETDAVSKDATVGGIWDMLNKAAADPNAPPTTAVVSTETLDNGAGGGAFVDPDDVPHEKEEAPAEDAGMEGAAAGGGAFVDPDDVPETLYSAKEADELRMKEMSSNMSDLEFLKSQKGFVRLESGIRASIKTGSVVARSSMFGGAVPEIEKKMSKKVKKEKKKQEEKEEPASTEEVAVADVPGGGDIIESGGESDHEEKEENVESVESEPVQKQEEEEPVESAPVQQEEVNEPVESEPVQTEDPVKSEPAQTEEAAVSEPAESEPAQTEEVAVSEALEAEAVQKEEEEPEKKEEAVEQPPAPAPIQDSAEIKELAEGEGEKIEKEEVEVEPEEVESDPVQKEEVGIDPAAVVAPPPTPIQNVAEVEEGGEGEGEGEAVQKEEVEPPVQEKADLKRAPDHEREGGPPPIPVQVAESVGGADEKRTPRHGARNLEEKNVKVNNDEPPPGTPKKIESEPTASLPEPQQEEKPAAINGDARVGGIWDMLNKAAASSEPVQTELPSNQSSEGIVKAVQTLQNNEAAVVVPPEKTQVLQNEKQPVVPASSEGVIKEHPEEPVAAARGEANHDVKVIDFPPGGFGLSFHLHSGEVFKLTEGGAAQKLGVQLGWVLKSINDIAYRKDMLGKINVNEMNSILFSTVQSSKAPQFKDVVFPAGSFGMQFNVNTGVVTNVIEGKIAHQMGVQKGWVLVKVNKITYFRELLSKINRQDSNVLTFKIPGSSAPRNRTQSIKKGPVEVPVAVFQKREFIFGPGSFGFQLDFSNGEITSCIAGGQAEELGVRAGWHLLSINGVPFNKEMIKQINNKIQNKIAFRLPAHTRESIKVVSKTFPEGSFGLQCDIPSGVVTMIRPGFAAEKLGVKVGWQIISINNEMYHPKLLTSINQKTGNVVKFKLPGPRPQQAQPQNEVKVVKHAAMPPLYLEISGREGYNNHMNGIYKRGGIHDGRISYKHLKNTFVIRWCPAKRRWFFDFRGLQSDNIASACVQDEAPSPDLIQKNWIVFDADKNTWVEDSKIRITKAQVNSAHHEVLE